MKRLKVKGSTEQSLRHSDADRAIKLREWGLEKADLFDLVMLTRTLGAEGGIRINADQWCKATSEGELEPDLGVVGVGTPREKVRLTVEVTGYSIELAIAKTYLLWKQAWEKWANQKLKGSWPGN